MAERKKIEKKSKHEEKLAAKGKVQKKRQRRATSLSSSEEEKVRVEYMESDSCYNETKICPGCQTDDALGDEDEWIQCRKCPRSWHVSCTGDALMLEIPVEQLKSYPFCGDYCI